MKVWVITDALGSVCTALKKKENVLAYFINRLETSNLTPDNRWQAFSDFFSVYFSSEDYFCIHIGEGALYAELTEIADEDEEED